RSDDVLENRVQIEPLVAPLGDDAVDDDGREPGDDGGLVEVAAAGHDRHRELVDALVHAILYVLEHGGDLTLVEADTGPDADRGRCHAAAAAPGRHVLRDARVAGGTVEE